MLLTTGLIVLEVSLCSKYPIPNTCPLLYCALYCIVYHIVSNCWRYLDPQQCCWPPSSLCWSSWLSTCQCRDEENYNQRYHNIPINFFSQSTGPERRTPNIWEIRRLQSFGIAKSAPLWRIVVNVASGRRVDEEGQEGKCYKESGSNVLPSPPWSRRRGGAHWHGGWGVE